MKPTRNFWPYGIILSFVVFISATTGLIVMACGQKTDLVSSDYYEQEIRFQNHLDRAARAQGVGASVTYIPGSRQIEIELPPAIAAVETAGHIQLYRPSAAKLDRQFSLDLDARGVQTLDASALAPGLWKARVTWTSGGKDFFIEQQITIK